MINNNKNIGIFLGIIVFLLLNVTFVFAYELSWPNSPTGTSIQDGADIVVLVKYIYEWGISIGSLCAFIAIIIAGVKYMTSVGNPSQIQQAQSDIRDAFIGLAILLSSWVILNTINPDLVSLKLPSIEKAENFDDLTMNADLLPKGQCEMVVFWDEKNFKGTSLPIDIFETRREFAGTVGSKSSPIGFFSGILTDFNPVSFIAYRKKVVEDSGDPENSQAKIDEVLCDNYAKQNEKYCTGDYIRDDNCLVEIYASSDWWNALDNCGDKMLSLSGYSKDMTIALANPSDDLACYKLIRGEEDNNE